MAKDEERTDRINEFFDELALQKRAPAGPAPTGECLNCGTPLLPPRRWCDADCRDDWERSAS